MDITKDELLSSFWLQAAASSLYAYTYSDIQFVVVLLDSI